MENERKIPAHTDEEKKIVEPHFVTDSKGKVYCSKHTYVSSLEESGYPVCLDDVCIVPGGESMLTCKTCGHYFNDDCFFPKDTIEEIEGERKRGKVLCDLCGERIHLSPVVFQKLFYKDKYNVDMPLVCCGCYASLRDNQFMERTRTKIILMIISIVISVFFLINYFFTMLFLTQWGILVLIAPITFWAWAAWKDARRIYYAWRGKKYYENLTEAMNEEEMEEQEPNEKERVRFFRTDEVEY